MQRQVVSTSIAACIGALLVTGIERPPLQYAERLALMIHELFPDKPRDVSFIDYFRDFTEINANLTQALEKLEFGVLDADSLDVAIKLAEDTRRLREMAEASVARRADVTFKPAGIFNYVNNSYAWDLTERRKLFEFIQHSVYATRYEVNKLRVLRLKYRNSTVYRMGVRMGNNLQLKVTAGSLYSTMYQMALNVSMLWYVFHYHKLLNINYDMTSNTEFAFLLQQQLNDGVLHLKFDQGKVSGVPGLPIDSVEATSEDPEKLYNKKK